MNHLERFQAQLKYCKEGVDDRYSLPFISYWDKSIYRQELSSLFCKQWIGLGRCDRLIESGEYEAFDLAGKSLLLIRDKENTLRLFANTCRHRGAKLLKDSGQCQAISCPFHGWTYTLNGDLIAAKSMADTPNFDACDYPLHEYKLQQYCGFLFAHLGDSPSNLKRHLGGFSVLHQPWNLENLVTTRRRTFEVDCNWKAFLDVFNEYYHLSHVHPTSIGNLYLEPEMAESTTGSYTTQFGRTKGTGALLEKQQQNSLPEIVGLSEPWRQGTRYTWMFPNMAFAAGQEALWLYEANPISPISCRVTQSICFPKSTTMLNDFSEKSQAYYQRLDAAMAEDIVALENQCQGLKNSPNMQGRFSSLMEANVHSFSQWYATHMLNH